MKSVLDACCGPRSFWFDKKDERCLFVDVEACPIREISRCRKCGEVTLICAEYYTYCLNCLTEVLHDFRTIVAELKERGT